MLWTRSLVEVYGISTASINTIDDGSDGLPSYTSFRVHCVINPNKLIFITEVFLWQPKWLVRGLPKKAMNCMDYIISNCRFILWTINKQRGGRKSMLSIFNSKWDLGARFFPHNERAPSGSGLPLYRSLTISFRHTTISRTHLEGWSTCLRNFYLTTRRYLSPAWFEPTIATSEWLQFHVQPMGSALS
jgi:hypothetical protein